MERVERGAKPGDLGFCGEGRGWKGGGKGGGKGRVTDWRREGTGLSTPFHPPFHPIRATGFRRWEGLAPLSTLSTPQAAGGA
nr:hypothetical protein KitaXyl93_36100 [Kitasatospora sp. Xyl93]